MFLDTIAQMKVNINSLWIRVYTYHSSTSMNNHTDANGGIGNQNVDGNQDHQVHWGFYNNHCSPILQIPQCLLQLIPRPRDVTFTLTEGQLVSNDLFRSYNFDIFKAINVHYMGWRANAHVSRSIPPWSTTSAPPSAPGLLRSNVHNDSALGRKGAPNFWVGDAGVGASPGTLRCRLGLLGKLLWNMKLWMDLQILDHMGWKFEAGIRLSICTYWTRVWYTL